MKIIVKSNVIVILSFALFAFLTYHPILTSGFMGDDSGQIVTNTFIRSLKNIFSFFQGGTFFTGGLENRLLSDYYRPIMVIWYSFIYSLFGLNPFFFHISQLFIHIINGFLVFLILKTFLSDKKLSYLLALVFLVHPFNVETVAYLATIQDILFFLFGSLGLYLFIRKKNSSIALIVVLFLNLVALLSKEIAVVFSIVLIAYMEIFRVNTYIYRLFWLGSTISMGFYIYLRCFLAHICTLGGGGHSVIPIARMTLFERMRQVPAMLFFYIKTFFFPKDLATFQYWIAKENLYELYIPLVVVLIFFAIIIALPFYIYINNKKLPDYVIKKWSAQNAHYAKTYAFFLTWFLIGLLLHINILPLDSTVAERWFYFPMVGMLGIIGVVITLTKKKSFIYFFLILVVFAFAVRTYMRALDWQDPFILLSKDIQISHNSASLENNYGSLLFQKGKLSEAEIHFRKAISLAPESSIYWCNLAELYEKKRDYTKAEVYYLKSIKYGRFYRAFERYINLLLMTGKKQKAKRFLKEKAIPTFPYNSNYKKIYEHIN